MSLEWRMYASLKGVQKWELAKNRRFTCLLHHNTAPPPPKKKKKKKKTYSHLLPLDLTLPSSKVCCVTLNCLTILTAPIPLKIFGSINLHETIFIYFLPPGELWPNQTMQTKDIDLFNKISDPHALFFKEAARQEINLPYIQATSFSSF